MGGTSSKEENESMDRKFRELTHILRNIRREGEAYLEKNNPEDFMSTDEEFESEEEKAKYKETKCQQDALRGAILNFVSGTGGLWAIYKHLPEGAKKDLMGEVIKLIEILGELISYLLTGVTNIVKAICKLIVGIVDAIKVVFDFVVQAMKQILEAIFNNLKVFAIILIGLATLGGIYYLAKHTSFFSSILDAILRFF